MKIVHVITRLIVGGAQENTLISCRLLAERGHDVTLVTGPSTGPEGKLLENDENAPYDVITAPKMIRAIHPIYDIIAYRQVKEILTDLKADIVHTHSAKAGILGRLAGHAMKNKYAPGRPAVVHTIHGLAFHPYQNRLYNGIYIGAERFAAKRTDFFLTVADAMTDQSLAAGIGKPEQYETAYSAIDENAFLTDPGEKAKANFRKEHKIPEDAVVLVTIARLFHLKGHEFIIESAKQLAPKHPKAIWLFVGDGILTEHYKKQIADAGLSDRFRFTGLLRPEQIPPAIHSCEILVHCSLREGLARALPQGLLCGKPVVSFDVDGAREVVNDKTGRLIRPKDTEALTAACGELISDGELRLKLGKQGRQAVKTRFAPDTMVDTIERTYENLLAR